VQDGLLPIAQILILLCPLLAVALGLIGIVVPVRLKIVQPSPGRTVWAALPALLCLALFYSLAAHMHQSLGAWPTSIGERGFPPALAAHASAANAYFMALILLNLSVWPVAYLLCALIRRWRASLYYLGVHMLACLLCLGLMLLAPGPFLYWWWD